MYVSPLGLSVQESRPRPLPGLTRRRSEAYEQGRIKRQHIYFLFFLPGLRHKQRGRIKRQQIY